MKLQMELDGFAFRSFREIADQDYIAARQCYFSMLPFQFNWSALQALEKYLKAILLFNRIPSIKDRNTKFGKDVGHDLIKAYKRIQLNPHIGLELTPKELGTLEFFNKCGVNRYFNEKLKNDEIGLEDLDELVFKIRSACKANWVYSRPENLDDTFSSPKIVKHQSTTSEYLRIGHRGESYWPKSGFLEDILIKDSSDPRWQALTRNNKYFGEREPDDFRFFSYASPIHKLYPDCISELKKLVKL